MTINQPVIIAALIGLCVGFAWEIFIIIKIIMLIIRKDGERDE